MTRQIHAFKMHQAARLGESQGPAMHRRSNDDGRSTVPRVSVIIPAKDAAASIGATLESLAADARVIAEVVIVDDASQDDTVARAHDAAVKLGLPVRFVRGAGRGAGAARNAGMRAVENDLIYFIDADDEVIAGGLTALHDRLVGDPSIGLAVGAYVRRVEGRPDKACPVGWFSANKIENVRRYVTDEVRSIAMGSGLVRRSAIGRASFAENLAFEEDTCFWITALAHGRVATVATPVMVYNVSISRSDDRFATSPRRNFVEVSRSFRRLVAAGDIERDYARLRRTLIALKTARVCYRRGDMRAASRFIRLVNMSGLGFIRQWQALRYAARIGLRRRLEGSAERPRDSATVAARVPDGATSRN